MVMLEQDLNLPESNIKPFEQQSSAYQQRSNFVPGVWGPYFSAMVPGFWLNEGGQSVTGKLIDHMVQGHAAFPELQAKATARCQSIYAYLNNHLDSIKKAQPVGFLTVDLHVWPDFHGNRSPLADLTLKGM
ncbi:hypothetical protein STEG23_032341, partial [Scotinomys teguina]